MSKTYAKLNPDLRPAITFPGTLIEGIDVVVTTIPTTEASYGGEYEEGCPVDYKGYTWFVLEWNFAHNCFIVTDYEYADVLAGDDGKLALFEFCQRVWEEAPESSMPETVTHTYQPRLL